MIRISVDLPPPRFKLSPAKICQYKRIPRTKANRFYFSSAPKTNINQRAYRHLALSMEIIVSEDERKMIDAILRVHSYAGA